MAIAAILSTIFGALASIKLGPLVRLSEWFDERYIDNVREFDSLSVESLDVAQRRARGKDGRKGKNRKKEAKYIAREELSSDREAVLGSTEPSERSCVAGPSTYRNIENGQAASTSQTEAYPRLSRHHANMAPRIRPEDMYARFPMSRDPYQSPDNVPSRSLISERFSNFVAPLMSLIDGLRSRRARRVHVVDSLESMRDVSNTADDGEIEDELDQAVKRWNCDLMAYIRDQEKALGIKYIDNNTEKAHHPFEINNDIAKEERTQQIQLSVDQQMAELDKDLQTINRNKGKWGLLSRWKKRKT